MRDIGASITDISIHFPQDPYVFIAVEKRVFVFSMRSRAIRAAM